MIMSRKKPQPQSNVPARIAARYWHATMSRDGRPDGTFVLAVRPTPIFCRPSCPARRPLRRNVVFFRTGAEAEQQGFRPCLRCRPNEVAGSVALVEHAARELAQSDEDSVRFSVLAVRLGTTAATLRRPFLQTTCLRPPDLAAALLLTRFKKLLPDGKSIA